MTISEVSEKTGLTADTLRYYEKIGLIPSVPRNGSGMRNYGESAIKWISCIQSFKAIGMPLESIQTYMKLAALGSSTRHERKELLIEARKNIAKEIDGLFSRLKLADYQLEHYESGIMRETEDTAACWEAAGRQAALRAPAAPWRR